MRYRVLDQLFANSAVYTDENSGSKDADSVTVKDAGIIGKKIETWDVETPNFHKRIAAGEIIVNPYRHLEEIRSNSINGIIVESPPNNDGSIPLATRDGPQLTQLLENDLQHSTTDSGRLSSRRLFSAEEVNSLTDIAATKCWADVAGSEAQILVFLAELHKTLAMLRNPTKNLIKFLKKVLRDKRRDSRALVRGLTCAEYLAQEWLAYRFGVRPLLYDIQSIVSALQKKKKSGKRRAHGFAADERTSTTRYSYPHGIVNTVYDRITIHRVEVRCGFLHSAELATQDYLGLSLKDVPAALWELIPFSFVIDWFFNVGTWVQSLVPSASVPISGAYTTVTHSYQEMRVVAGSNLGSDLTHTLLRQMSGVETLTVTDRVRRVGVNKPSLASRLTLSDLKLSDLRILDSLALVFQLLRTK